MFLGRMQVSLLRVIKDLQIPIMQGEDGEVGRISYHETFKACVRRVLSGLFCFTFSVFYIRLVPECLQKRIAFLPANVRVYVRKKALGKESDLSNSVHIKMNDCVTTCVHACSCNLFVLVHLTSLALLHLPRLLLPSPCICPLCLASSSDDGFEDHAAEDHEERKEVVDVNKTESKTATAAQDYAARCCIQALFPFIHARIYTYRE